jgi:hypothetical protein
MTDRDHAWKSRIVYNEWVRKYIYILNNDCKPYCAEIRSYLDVWAPHHDLNLQNLFPILIYAPTHGSKDPYSLERLFHSIHYVGCRKDNCLDRFTKDFRENVNNLTYYHHMRPNDEDIMFESMTNELIPQISGVINSIPDWSKMIREESLRE